jgi:hypothetical protein
VSYITNQEDVALAILGRGSLDRSSLGLGERHPHRLPPGAREASRFHQLLDARDHRRILPSGRGAETVLDMEIPPPGHRNVEELLDFAMQAFEVVEIPLSRIMAAEASIVLIVGVQGQFELFAHVDIFFSEHTLKPPILQIASGLAVPDPGCDFVCSFNAVDAGPSVESARIAPVGPDGIGHALPKVRGQPRQWEESICDLDLLNKFGQHRFQPRYRVFVSRT